MAAVDFFLNLAALLMWLSWRGVGGTHTAGAAGTILGNLRSAENRLQRRWSYLGGLVGLLVARAVVYRQVGPSLYWHPSWSAGAVSVSFRSDSLARMFAFSFASFGWFLLGLYTWAVGILAFNRPPHDKDGLTRALRRRFDRWASLPVPVLVALPWMAAALAWVGIGGWASSARLLPPVTGLPHLLQQAVVVGLSAWCLWRWLLLAVLVLHFVNTYVYLGAHPVWDFVQKTGLRLCTPFGWMRLGRADFSPVPAALVLFGLPTLLASGIPPLKAWLPGIPAWLEYGILPAVFRSLPWG